MRRLGERREYGPYHGTLGRAVHNDYHSWMLLVTEDDFELQDLSTGDHKEQLPAANESHWKIETGHGKIDGYNYPYEGLLDAINRHGRRGAELARVKKAWERLQDWEPGGRLLHSVVYVDCMARRVVLDGDRGWRHGDKRYYRARERAWDIIAVLAVDGDILRRAQDAGAVDEGAVAWAKERGLI